MSIIKSLLQHLGIWLAIISSLNVCLYISIKIPSLGTFILLVWLIAWLVSYRTSNKNRYRHIVPLFLNIIISIFIAVLLYLSLYKYNISLNSLSHQTLNIINAVFSFFHISKPQLQFNVMLVFSILYACILLMFRTSFILVLNKYGEKLDTYLQEVYEITYISEPTQKYLKPWLHFAKDFSLVFFVIGGCLFIWYFWIGFHSTYNLLEWIVWFFNLLIIISIDWYFLFSGELHRYSRDNMNSDDEIDRDKELAFEDLWKRYHKFWKDKWHVAGNISTGPTRDD